MLSILLATQVALAQDSLYPRCTDLPSEKVAVAQGIARVAGDSVERARWAAQYKLERELALEFAPILRFADGERYFPTSPILSAMDGRDNDSTGARDFADIREVAPTTDGIHLSWNWLHRFYANDLPWTGLELVAVAEAPPSDTLTVKGPSDTAEKKAELDTLEQKADSLERAPGETKAAQFQHELGELTQRLVDLQRRFDSLSSDRDTLKSVVSSLTDQKRLPGASPVRRALERSVVFYRVCRLTAPESGHIWRYLRSDEQAWKRFHGADLTGEEAPEVLAQPVDSVEITAFNNTRRRREPFLVVQYYLYYMRDAGLQGHEQDIEMVFVFLPMNRNEFGGLRILVGGGHSSRTPNNVLVLTNRDTVAGQQIRKADTIYSRRPPEESPNIQVELGGHSSATDVPPFGIFIPGVDVNWHIYRVWGTRDVQAVGGVGYYGAYKPEMDFERDARSSLTLFPPREGYRETVADTGRIRYVLSSLTDFKAVVGMASDPSASDAVFKTFVDSTLVKDFRKPWGFHGFHSGSLPIWDVREAIRLWARPMAVDKRHRKLITPPSLEIAGGAALPDGASHLLNQASAPANRTISESKHLPWLHTQYRDDPTTIFKGRLFRPTLRGISDALDVVRLLTWGVTFHPSAATEYHMGFVIPAFHLRILPIRLPGFLELQGGFYRPRMFRSERSSFAAAIVWQHSYDGYVGWYQRLGFVPHRERSINIEDASDWTFSTGVSVLPWLTRKRPFSLMNAVRLGFGVHLDLKPWPDAFRRAGWEFSIYFRQ